MRKLRHRKSNKLPKVMCSVAQSNPWTVAHQASLSMGFFRQEYRSGLPLPPPRHLPDPGIEPLSPVSPESVGRLFTSKAAGKPLPKVTQPQSGRARN